LDHPSEQTIIEFRKRQLPPAELLALDEHLAECAKCQLLWTEGRTEVNEATKTFYEDLLASDLASDDHLTYEALESLVDGEANALDREIAQVHLEVCSRCAAELSALEKLRDEKPIVIPDQSVIAGGWTWPKIAFAAFATLFVVSLIWIAWSKRSSDIPPGTQIAVLPSPSPVNSGSPTIQASPNPSPEVLVSLQDGGTAITKDASGEIAGLDGLGDLSTVTKATVRTGLTGSIEVGPTYDRGKTETLMGGVGEGRPFGLLSPVRIVSMSNQPIFRWEPYEGATAYVVKIYDSNYKEVAASTTQTLTEWRIPSALRRGETYSWQVTAIRNGEEIKSPTPPAREAQFRVISNEVYVEIQKAQQRKPNSHLVLGLLYARAGLLKQAEKEFQLLLKANPNSNVVKDLLAQVKRN